MSYNPEIATRELRSEWSISRPALALPPPTGTAAGPRRRPWAPQPGPAADHGHRSRAPPPPTGTAAGPRHHPRAPQPGPAARPPVRPCPPVPPAPSTPAAQPEFAVELVACGSAGVPGAVGPGRPRDRHTRACGSEVSISKPARALRSLRRPPHQWRLVADVLLGALARSPARPPLPTGTAAGNSRETVITFAGVCFASGETDNTIASQIHLFSAEFWRAKASWVSYRRPEAPALVPTVTSRGAVSSMGATKFAQCRLSMAIA